QAGAGWCETRVARRREVAAGGDLAGSLSVPACDFESLRRVVADEGRALEKVRRPLADCRPGLGVNLKMVGAVLEPDLGGGRRPRPAEGPTSSELFEHVLDQGDGADQVQVLGVVVEVIVQDTVGAQPGEQGRTIDQQATMAARDGSDDVAEIGRAAQGEAIK